MSQLLEGGSAIGIGCLGGIDGCEELLGTEALTVAILTFGLFNSGQKLGICIDRHLSSLGSLAQRCRHLDVTGCNALGQFSLSSGNAGLEGFLCDGVHLQIDERSSGIDVALQLGGVVGITAAYIVETEVVHRNPVT